MPNPNNLLIIMSDEHQAQVTGSAGHPFIHTPNLDRLAERGLRFSDAYTPSPICVPARASFATGLYPHQLHLWDNAMPYTGQVPGWGHALQRRGVAVESIGKLHYRHQDDDDGFEAKHIPMMVVGGVGMVWASIRREDQRVIADGRMLGDTIGPGSSPYTEYDAAVTQRAVDWLSERDNTSTLPWCLFVGLVAPHFPLVVAQQYFDLYPEAILPTPKLHPKGGYQRHPWVEKQNAFMDSESKFHDWTERRAAESAYYGLVSWLDDNVGQILSALNAAGLDDTTTVIYTSDHGDNIGARGLWGKSNLYQESAAVPLIISGPGIKPGVCRTPVSLIDVSTTVAEHFGGHLSTSSPGRSLTDIAASTEDTQRVVFSEYHAAGAVSGAFMLRKGRYKYIHYVGFEPELFDLQNDPEETINLAADPKYHEPLAELRAALYEICDPEQTDASAHADQAALIARLGGREKALQLGARGATPAPQARHD